MIIHKVLIDGGTSHLSVSVLLDGGLFWGAVLEPGAGGYAIALPVACVLTIMAPTFSARVHPDRVSSRDHLTPRVVHITVRTLLALGTALPGLVHWVYTGRRGTVRHQTAGNAISVTGALFTLRGLKVLPQLIHHPSVLAADPLAARAAVCGVVAHMDAGGRERRALGAGTRSTFCRALALGAVVGVQEIPLSHVVNAPVGLTGALLLPGH